MGMTEPSKEPGGIVLKVASVEVTATVMPATLVLTYRYAPEWFRDAVQEAQRAVGDAAARRREMLFAVCCAESYLYEWTYGLLQAWAQVRNPPAAIRGRHAHEAITDYYSAGQKGAVRDRWKDVPKRLKENGLIDESPGSNDHHRNDWNMLIDYRDAFTHAKVSRPVVRGPAQPPLAPAQQPTRETLVAAQPGWAIRIVVEQIRRLHKAANTDHLAPLPDWVQDP